MDFRSFDVLTFYFKCLDSNPGDPSIFLKTWDRSSHTVSIRTYLEGGALNGDWQKVKIPLTDLATNDWDLGNVEGLAFGKDPERRTYLVDRIRLGKETAPALVVTGKAAPFPESNQVLKLTFTGKFLRESLRNRDSYALDSPTDPVYQEPVHPMDTGIHFRLESFSSSGGPVNRYETFVQFATPFQNRHTYRLQVQGIVDGFCNPIASAEYSFVYDDEALLNPNVKINQIGYHPDRPKRGYVGGYAGDLGGGVWAVGDGGLVLKRNRSGQWDQAPSLTERTLRAVCATREDDVWVAGDAGIMLHWDGTQWTAIPMPDSQDLRSISFGPTGIGWAVGAAGTTLRYENSVWMPVAAPTTADLEGIWAGPQDTAWAVGDGGVLLRWSGQTWVKEESPTAAALYGISGPHEDWLWAAGEKGTVMVRRQGRWRLFKPAPATFLCLRSVTASLGGDVWITGDQGVMWYKKGFGSSGFETKETGTSKGLLGIARQHEGKMWAVGEKGTVLSSAPDAWELVDLPIEDPIHGVFALGYGPIRLPKDLPMVSIRDVSSASTVLQAPLKQEAANWPLSGEDVYSFDFSSLKTPGIYQAHVPGVGLSDPFAVDSNILKDPARTLARGLYYQRCGTVLPTTFAGAHARPLCHKQDPEVRPIDAFFHESLLKSPLYAGEIPGGMADVHGGWHDAGDYGKYMPTSAAALWHLLTAYELDPKAFSDGDLGIPESGNRVPDILDEARWELDWICRMQNANGGFYHKVTSETWFKGMPEQEENPRYLFEMTTHDTALATAVLALSARIWQTYDEQASRTFLERAERGWEFLKSHPDTLPAGGFRNPKGVVTGEYNDPEDGDNRLWAAAELYRTTGKTEYGAWFISWWQQHDHAWGWSPWQHAYPYACWAYLHSRWPDASPEVQKDIREHLLRKAQESLQKSATQPYSSAARLDVPEWIGWGSFSQSAEYAFLLLQAWVLTKDDRYLNGAFQNLDVQFGANPLSMCFVTGMGSRSPRDPLHMPSLYDGVDEPVPGIPVFGSAAHLTQNNPFYRAAQDPENLYPRGQSPADPYPILRRYWDAHELVPMSEFTIVDMAIAAGVMGVLSHP